MESDLLEISQVDDDSLLLQHHHVQNGDVSACNASPFSCSPLQLPRSKPIPSDEEAKNPRVTLKIEKENINSNTHKLEVPKLNLEPQQMKRKKKGGGYNLRKSLAWNRAFFTEEGVLNSTELSLISGEFSNLSGEKLSVIEEERRESLSGDSPDLENLENNLFKQPPLNDSDKNGEKKIGSSLLKKRSASTQRSTAKPNVLSVHDVSRSGSKRSGCPRPVISSALKRPATVSTTKTAIKEPSVSKIPVPSSDSSVLSRTAKSAPIMNKPKRNQSAQADINAKRSIGLTGLKKTTKSTQSAAKSIPSGRPQRMKSSVQPAKRNVGSSVLASHSSTSLHPPVFTKADNGAKVNQDPVFPDDQGSINQEPSSSGVASVPRSGYHIGGNSQYMQPKMPKPSGLRMPSPSLGFFTQSKSNISQNLQNNIQPCSNVQSNIPKLRKIVNSIREETTPSMKEPVVANGVAGIKNKRMPIVESCIPSSVNSSCENIRSNSQISAVQVEICHNSNENDQLTLHATDSDLRQQVDTVGLQFTDNKLVLQSQSLEPVNLEHKSRVDLVIPPSHQDELKNYHNLSQHNLQMTSALKTDFIGTQVSGNVQHRLLTEDFDLLEHLHSNYVNSSDTKGSKVNDDQISSTQVSQEEPSKQEIKGKSCSFNDNQMINEIEGPDINHSIILKEGEPSVKFLDHDSVQSYDICEKVVDRSASELERSNDLSQYGDRVQAKDDTGEAAEYELKIHLGDAQLHALNVDLSLETSEGNKYNLSTECDSPVCEPVESITCHVGSLPVLNNSSFYKQNDCEKSIGQFELIQSTETCISSLENKISEAYLGFLPAVGKTFEEPLKFNSDNHGDLCPEDKISARQEVEDHFDHSQVERTDEPKEKCAAEAQDVDHAQFYCDHLTVDLKEKCVADEPRNDLMGSRLSGNEHHSSLMEDFDLLQQLHSNDVNSIKNDGSSKVNDDRISSMLNSHEEPSKQDERQIFCISDDNQMINEIENPKINHSAFFEGESSEKIDYDGVQSYGICQKARYCSASDLEMSNGLSHHRDRLQGEDGTGEAAELNLKIHVGDAQTKEAIHSECHAGSHCEPKEKCAAEVHEMTERCLELHAHSEPFDKIIQLDSCKNIIFTSAENDHFAVAVQDINEPPVLQHVNAKQNLPEILGLSTNEEVSSSVKVNVSDNNHDYHNEQRYQSTSLNCALPSFHEEEISGAGNTFNTQAFCSLGGGPIFKTEANQTLSSGNASLEEFNNSKENLQLKLNSASIPMDAKGITTSIEKSENDKKQDAPAVKAPTNAVPFSDEWLAALEAAGEEILTMKTGAVQHSPKDKSLPEPGPWSPVRKKNNQGFGPFDCTKFTNTNIKPGSEL